MDIGKILSSCFLASIGPRALARGKVPDNADGSFDEECFNWATRSRAWKGCHAMASKILIPCFNWATRSRAWKGRAEQELADLKSGLQLGHALSRVERYSNCPSSTMFVWLQLGHALSRVESGSFQITTRECSSFNWATRYRAWKVATRSTK